MDLLKSGSIHTFIGSTITQQYKEGWSSVLLRVLIKLGASPIKQIKS